MSDLLSLPEPGLMVARPEDAPTVYPYQRAVDSALRQAQADLVLKAPIASPTFTGDPKAPTPSSGDNDTSIATTAFVQTALTGHIIRVLQTAYTSNADLTTALPIDDSIPQSGEGDEVLSQAITLGAAANKVLLLIDLFGAVNNQEIAFALFRGTTCIFAKTCDTRSSGNAQDGNGIWLDTPGSVGPHTYSVRVGATSGAAVRLNGDTSGRYFGGAAACTLTLMEIKG